MHFFAECGEVIGPELGRFAAVPFWFGIGSPGGAVSFVQLGCCGGGGGRICRYGIDAEEVGGGVFFRGEEFRQRGGEFIKERFFIV